MKYILIVLSVALFSCHSRRYRQGREMFDRYDDSCEHYHRRFEQVPILSDSAFYYIERQAVCIDSMRRGYDMMYR